MKPFEESDLTTKSARNGFRASGAGLRLAPLVFGCSLSGCNLANYEDRSVRSIVEIESVSERLITEEASLQQDPDGSIRAVLEQSFEVQREEVKKEEVTRTVYGFDVFEWIFAETLFDPLSFLIYLLDFGDAPRDQRGKYYPSADNEYAAMTALLFLPGIYWAPAREVNGESRRIMGGEPRESTSTRARTRKALEPVVRTESIVAPRLTVLVDGAVVETDGEVLQVRQCAWDALSTGAEPSVTIDFEDRKHDVELTFDMASASVAALNGGDVPWRRAIDYHGLIYRSPEGSPVAASLIRARSGESGRWMAAMQRADWQVIASESSERMPDGAIVDFRGLVGSIQEQAAAAARLRDAAVEVVLPEGEVRGEFVAKLTVSNPTDADLWQVVVVLDSADTGLCPVPIGRIPAGGSVQRFVTMTARGLLENPPVAALRSWRGLPAGVEDPVPGPAPKGAMSLAPWQEYVAKADSYAEKALDESAGNGSTRRSAMRLEVRNLERAMKRAPASETGALESRIEMVKRRIQESRKRSEFEESN